MSEVDLDQLLQYLEEDEKDPVIKKPNKKDFIHRSIRKFVKHFEIKPGATKVPNYLIYMEYRRYYKNYNSNCLRPHAFFQHFSRMFKRGRNGRERFYLLNEVFSVSKEYKEQTCRTYRAYYGKKNKRKQDKKETGH